MAHAGGRQARRGPPLRRERPHRVNVGGRAPTGRIRPRLRPRGRGRWRQPFREKGLRSEWLGLPGKMFVAACRRGGKLRSSWDKANLAVEARSKLLALDLPYVEGNKEVLQFWRIDLDRSWPSVRHCIDDIEELVGWKIPHAPHLVVGDERPDGEFVRPHLIFMLPPGSGVWNDADDPRCRMRVVEFFQGVGYGLVDALRSLGADPVAPLLTLRTKNTLSPLWKSFSLNTGEFLSLTEWAGWVDTRVDRDTLIRTTPDSTCRHPTVSSTPSRKRPIGC